jgi:hypothetical protein
MDFSSVDAIALQLWVHLMSNRDALVFWCDLDAWPVGRRLAIALIGTLVFCPGRYISACSTKGFVHSDRDHNSRTSVCESRRAHGPAWQSLQT